MLQVGRVISKQPKSSCATDGCSVPLPDKLSFCALRFSLNARPLTPGSFQQLGTGVRDYNKEPNHLGCITFSNHLLNVLVGWL